MTEVIKVLSPSQELARKTARAQHLWDSGHENHAESLKLIKEILANKEWQGIYPSADAYLKEGFGDRFRGASKGERVDLVETLTGEISQRAIATLLRAAQKTISRDVAQLSQNDSVSDQKQTPKKSVGKDGKARGPKRVTYKANPTEIARRRDHILREWNAGQSASKINEALGIGWGTLQQDRAALGLEGDRPRSLTLADHAPLGHLAWKDGETDAAPSEENAPSVIINEETLACRIPEADEMIMSVDLKLEELTHNNRYRLGNRDRTKLIKILKKHLGRLEQ